ncbi:hypothetical protein EKO04_008442 [Ascochyta lentis]|uniref:Uncharacterized protein n=1 Tax=Ascochyta lentis TaxID=205686 RepID=A0A8H7MHS4_9PLEO|nr:hypothetical protein EKO04_008442 [Ascochyta lentis]
MSTSSTTSYKVIRPAANPAVLRGHIGDLPPQVLHRILHWKLLANGELPAVAAFVVATPFLAEQAGGSALLTACGLDWTTVMWQQDVDFWMRFRQLRQEQDREKSAREEWSTR